MVFFSIELGDKGAHNVCDEQNATIYVEKYTPITNLGEMQRVIYQHKIDLNIKTKTKKPISMIIPVPNNSGNPDDIKCSIGELEQNIEQINELKDLSVCSLWNYLFHNSSMREAQEHLPEHKHKKSLEYEMTTCGSFIDLQFLAEKFWIDPKVLEFIKNTYAHRKFGFIVAQITPAHNGKILTFAYTHHLPTSAILYIPTMGMPVDRSFFENNKKVHKRRFNHTIYSLNTIFNKVNQRDISLKDCYICETLKTKKYYGVVKYKDLQINEDTLAIDSIKNDWLSQNTGDRSIFKEPEQKEEPTYDSYDHRSRGPAYYDLNDITNYISNDKDQNRYEIDNNTQQPWDYFVQKDWSG